jgi:hypothetical protein
MFNVLISSEDEVVDHPSCPSDQDLLQRYYGRIELLTLSSAGIHQRTIKYRLEGTSNPNAGLGTYARDPEKRGPPGPVQSKFLVIPKSQESHRFSSESGFQTEVN